MYRLPLVKSVLLLVCVHVHRAGSYVGTLSVYEAPIDVREEWVTRDFQLSLVLEKSIRQKIENVVLG